MSQGRWWNRLSLSRRKWQRLELIYGPPYELKMAGVPHDPLRSERILSFLLDQDWVARRRLLVPQPVTLRLTQLVHTEDYLESLSSPEGLAQVVGFTPTPNQYELMLEAQRTIVGGTLEATRRALSRKAMVINLGGGFHHAAPGHGRGFCIFNDVAIAIREARQSGFDKRILVVDLDLHDGDGTRLAFAEDPSVFTFSIHNQAWDERPAIASRSVELAGEVSDRQLLDTLRHELPSVIHESQPEMVFYLAGADPAADDALGNWQLTDDGMLARDRLVIEELRRYARRLPCVVLLAGGYGRHAWRYPARFFAWLATGERVEPPATGEMTLGHYRRLTLGTPDNATDDGSWDLTEGDLSDVLDGAPRERRFLGHYTKHAIELALQKSGLLDRLHELGFEHSSVLLDTDNPTGQTLRVFVDSAHQELLAELRACRDRRTIDDMELVRVEWLLLQNPRGEFTAERPQLPGQTYPGLGILRDVIALLILMCERLQLDGLVWVPSHYRLAAQSGRYLRFVEPEAEARFLAMRQALSGISLIQAVQALAENRLLDSDSGKPVQWTPAPTVLAVSAKMRSRFDSSEYQQAVESATSELRFRLVSGDANHSSLGN